MTADDGAMIANGGAMTSDDGAMIIETGRCLIRPFSEQDLDAFMAYRNDLEWMRFQDFKGLTREAYEKALLGDSQLTQGCQLAIVDRQSGRLIGDLYVKADSGTNIATPGTENDASACTQTTASATASVSAAATDLTGYWIGYTVAPAFARQGYAFEAVSALIDALARTGATWIRASVDPGNGASIALLTKLGFTMTASSDREAVYEWLAAMK